MLLLAALAFACWSVFVRGEFEPAIGGRVGTTYFLMAIAATITLPPVLLAAFTIGALAFLRKHPNPSVVSLIVESLVAAVVGGTLVGLASRVPSDIRTLVFWSWLLLLLSSLFAYSLVLRIRTAQTRRRT
jgi:hypothetical protein